MTEKITIKASVGRQNFTALTPASEGAYISSIKAQMRGITDNLNSFVEQLKNIAPEVIYEALQPTFELSQEYVPVLTGALKDSGFLEQVEDRVYIGYGYSGNPEYASVVHENLEWHHEPPTRAKFLQDALEEQNEEIEQRIIKGLKEASST
jgi:hypothetical protein